MRSLVSDKRYFAFLNGLDDEILMHTQLAAVCLIQEFPHLRAEEAKAVWQDWRMSKQVPWKCVAGKQASTCEGLRGLRGLHL